MEVLNIFSCSLAAVHIFYGPNTFEPRHEKTNISHMQNQRRNNCEADQHFVSANEKTNILHMRK